MKKIGKYVYIEAHDISYLDFPHSFLSGVTHIAITFE